MIFREKRKLSIQGVVTPTDLCSDKNDISIMLLVFYQYMMKKRSAVKSGMIFKLFYRSINFPTNIMIINVELFGKKSFQF